MNSREEKWTNMYPKKPITYNAQYGRPRDPRTFIFSKSHILETIVKQYKLNKGTDNDKILECLKFVQKFIQYTGDNETKGQNEFWQNPEDTITLQKGDCIAEYEEIITPDGVVKASDIKIGDMVLSYDFNKNKYVYKPIINLWDKGIKPIRRVHFRNGQYIDVTDEHHMLMRTNQNGNSKYEKMDLKDVDLSKWWKRKVPIATKIPYNEVDIKWLTEDLCFILGYFLTAGWVIEEDVYILDYNIIPKLEKHNIPFSKHTNSSSVPYLKLHNSPITYFLKKQKTDNYDIHLEEILFHLPVNKLEYLLDGFWAGNKSKSKQESYSTSSKQLVDSIQRIGLQVGKTFQIWKQTYADNVPIWKIIYNTDDLFLKSYGHNGLSEISIIYIEDMGECQTYDWEVDDTHNFFFKNGVCTSQCEDGAILIKSLSLIAGVPDWKVRVCAGHVKGGGHAYCTYVRDDDTQCVMDWCIVDNTRTRINMVSGRAKRFKDIQIEDKVVGYNEETGALESTTVKKIGYREVDSVYKITYVDDYGTTKYLFCSKEHPWMINGVWVSTENIRIGDEIFYVKPGSIVNKFQRIVNIEKINKIHKVWNIHCSPHNNYFVNGLLSHNCYWPNRLPVNDRPSLADEKNYYEVWFSFNANYTFAPRPMTYSKGQLSL